MRREAETLSKRHARANCLLEIVAFVVESLKTSNFASNLPALGKNKKKLKKNESSKSKFDIRIRSRSFNIRSFDIRIADADFEFGANDVTFRYFDSSIFGAHYEVEAKDLQ